MATLGFAQVLLTLTAVPGSPRAGKKPQGTRGCTTAAAGSAVSPALVPSALTYLGAPIGCSRLDAVNKVIFTSNDGIFENRNWKCKLLTPFQVRSLKILQMRR